MSAIRGHSLPKYGNRRPVLGKGAEVAGLRDELSDADKSQGSWVVTSSLCTRTTSTNTPSTLDATYARLLSFPVASTLKITLLDPLRSWLFRSALTFTPLPVPIPSIQLSWTHSLVGLLLLSPPT
jgi:hypothetical protein